MNSKDLEIASKIGELVSHFSEEWLKYQDWLGDIVSSQHILLQRYPAWQAIVIFRWRLLYFITYVGTVIVINWLLKKPKILAKGIATIAQSIRLERYGYILHRTATLLAVVELTLCSIAAFTGILLAFYYQPTALEAGKSLTMIVNKVTNGSLIFSLHHFAGHSLIVLALLQIVVMFLGRQFLPSWLTAWISGVCLTLTAIGLSWTAIILNWEQTSFWRLKIELGIVASIPLVGSFLRDVLSGGSGISSITLQHMYALHSHVLVVLAISLSLIHLTALICLEQNQKFEDKRFKLGQLCNNYVSKKDSSI